MIDMHDYTPAAKRYWFACVAIGAAVLLWALLQLEQLSSTQMTYLLLGGAGAVFAGFFPVVYPNAKWSFTFADVFHLLVLQSVGPAGAILTVAIEGCIVAMRVSKRATSRVGTPAQVAIAMLIAAFIYKFVLQHLPEIGASKNAATLVGTFIAAAVHQVIASMLVILLLQLKKGIKFTLTHWWTQTGWMVPISVASAVVAGLTYITTQSIGLTAFLVAVPLIVLVSASLHYYYENVTSKMQTLEESERHLKALAASEQRFHQIFDQSAIGLSLVDDKLTIKQANPALKQMLGDASTRATTDALTQFISPEARDAFTAKFKQWALQPKAPLQTELPVDALNGTKLWLEVTLTAFDKEAQTSEGEDKRFVLQVNNFTRRRESENRLAYLALHDQLTGLANRAALVDALEHAIERSRVEKNFSYAVVMLDFDRFKLVNDSLGHVAGDEMLVKAAQRLRQFVRSDDIVARFGGDEFAILFQYVSNEQSAIDFAARMQAALSAPMTIAGLETCVTASLGITFSKFGYANASDVLRDADAAMYEAKRNATGAPVVFHSLLHEQAASVFRIEADLRKALRNKEFSVYYQPIQDLRRDRTTGFEALLRWHHPSRGLVLPSTFIQVAEQTGLINPIGRWVIQEVLRAAPQLLPLCDTTQEGALSINLSAAQLQEPGFANWLIDAVREQGLKTQDICLEVTEAIFIEGRRELSALTQLRAAGFSISLDDFGTGYSSLSYLQHIPASVLKLDGKFTRTLCDDLKVHHIVRCVMELTRSLNMRVCAEGVETQEQLDSLRELGVDSAQGFLLAKPMPLNSLIAELREVSYL
jgi:diguanylate cyclase (GGDEF)-like protein/PAS domain S-box-containing protein